MHTLFDLSSADMSPWLSQTITLCLKGMLVLGATGIMAYSLRQSAAAVRYLVWCAGLLSLMLLPLFSSALPAWELEILPATTSPGASLGRPAPGMPYSFEAPAPIQAPVVRPDQPAPIGRESSWLIQLPDYHWTTWLFLTWLTGMALVLGRLTIAHIGAYMLVRRSELVHDDDWHLLAESIQKRMGIQQMVRLRFSSWTSVPMSVGIWRPLIVLPADANEWDEDQRRTVLVHELAHVKRRDCLMHLLCQITCAFHWFNPLVWIAAWRMRVERERACDDRVLMYGINPSHYAETLLETAQRLRKAEWSTIAALSMARYSQLEGRLLSILDPVRRRQLNAPSTALTIVLIACIALPLAVMKPVQAQKAQTHRVAPPPRSVDVTPPEVDIEPVDIPPVNIPEMNIHIPPVVIPEIEIPEFEVTIPAINIPDIEVEIPEIAFDFEHYDGAKSMIHVDSLTVEQIIALRKYGIDAEIISELREMGYTDIMYEDLVALGKYGADAEYIREMRETGYDRLSLRDFARMSKYGVDEDFVRAMSEAGFDDLSAEDLISMSKYGVDEDLVESLGRYGYTDVSVDELIAASKYGVDEDLIENLSRSGFSNVSIDELVAMSKYGVDEELIEALGTYGYNNLSAGEIISASKYGIEEDLIIALRDNGYAEVSIGEIISMSKYGIDEDYIEEMAGTGLNAGIRDLIKLRKYDVDAEYIEAIQDAGIGEISIEQLIDMRKHGVDAEFIRELKGN